MVDNSTSVSKIEFDNDDVIDPSNVVYPPPEVRNIIEKTVPYVSRNGRKFESVLRNAQQNNKRFDFLDSNHIYHEYYKYQLQIHNDPEFAEKWRAKEQQIEDTQRQLYGDNASNDDSTQKNDKSKTKDEGGKENEGTGDKQNSNNANNDSGNNNNNNNNSASNNNDNSGSGDSGVKSSGIKVVELSLKQKIMQELALAKHPKDEYIMPPREHKFIIDWPGEITAYEMDVMKLTAQFNAIIGPSFMRTLKNEERDNNETFGFIEHYDPRIHIFNTLTSSYKEIMDNFNDYRRSKRLNNDRNRDTHRDRERDRNYNKRDRYDRYGDSRDRDERDQRDRRDRDRGRDNRDRDRDRDRDRNGDRYYRDSYRDRDRDRGDRERRDDNDNGNNNGSNNDKREDDDVDNVVDKFKSLHLDRDRLYYTAVGTAEYTRRLHNSQSNGDGTGSNGDYDDKDKEMLLIDWQDFVVLETIDFDENDVNLVPPGHNIHEINRILATAADLSQLNDDKNGQNQETNRNGEDSQWRQAGQPASSGAGTAVAAHDTIKDGRLHLGIGTGKEDEPAAPAATMESEGEESDAMDMSDSDSDEEEEQDDDVSKVHLDQSRLSSRMGGSLPQGIIGHSQLDVVPQLRGDGEGVDYDLELRRQLDKLLTESRTDQMQTQQCPICGENINVIELSQHIKIELLDPKWKEQKEMLKSRMAQTQLAADSQIAANIARFEQQRKKQYGSDNENEDDDGQNNNNNNGNKSNIAFNALPWDGHKGFSEEQARNIRKMQDKLNEEREKQQRKIERQKQMEKEKEIEKNSLLPKRLPSRLPPPIEKRDPIDAQHAPPAKRQKLNDGRSKGSN